MNKKYHQAGKKEPMTEHKKHETPQTEKPMKTGEETPEEVPENTEENNNITQGTTNEENLETPTTLPKTGNTAYITILPIMMVLVAMYFVLRKKD